MLLKKTYGNAETCASIADTGNPSNIEGKINMSKTQSKPAISSRIPNNLTFLFNFFIVM